MKDSESLIEKLARRREEGERGHLVVDASAASTEPKPQELRSQNPRPAEFEPQRIVPIGAQGLASAPTTEQTKHDSARATIRGNALARMWFGWLASAGIALLGFWMFTSVVSHRQATPAARPLPPLPTLPSAQTAPPPATGPAAPTTAPIAPTAPTYGPQLVPHTPPHSAPQLGPDAAQPPKKERPVPSTSIPAQGPKVQKVALHGKVLPSKTQIKSKSKRSAKRTVRRSNQRVAQLAL